MHATGAELTEHDHDSFYDMGSTLYSNPKLAEDFQNGHNFGYLLGFGTTIASSKAQPATSQGEGVVYLRTEPQSGEPYVGQAKSPERFDARKGEHNRKAGVQHDYEILGKAPPGTKLNVLEESKIRQLGGIQKNGGPLANKRHQMSDANYKAAGGDVPLPY